MAPVTSIKDIAITDSFHNFDGLPELRLMEATEEI